MDALNAAGFGHENHVGAGGKERFRPDDRYGSRRARTRDGFTVALGGLIRESGGVGNSGIPLLKDMPVVGNLFRNNTSDTRRTELVVLLVPHVMRNQMETQSVVDALVDGLDAASQLAEHARPLVRPRAQ